MNNGRSERQPPRCATVSSSTCVTRCEKADTDEVCTKAPTPAASAARSRFCVPCTLVAVCATAFGVHRLVSAAAWKTASQPASARVNAASSDRSARTGVAPSAASGASASARRDIARTSWPASRTRPSRSRWPPTKPLPPVRNTRAMVGSPE